MNYRGQTSNIEEMKVLFSNFNCSFKIPMFDWLILRIFICLQIAINWLLFFVVLSLCAMLFDIMIVLAIPADVMPSPVFNYLTTSSPIAFRDSITVFSMIKYTYVPAFIVTGLTVLELSILSFISREPFLFMELKYSICWLIILVIVVLIVSKFYS